MLEHAIETGRGGIYLRPTPEQYSRLLTGRTGSPTTSTFFEKPR